MGRKAKAERKEASSPKEEEEEDDGIVVLDEGVDPWSNLGPKATDEDNRRLKGGQPNKAMGPQGADT
jgi:hypothetical protein